MVVVVVGNFSASSRAPGARSPFDVHMSKAGSGPPTKGRVDVCVRGNAVWGWMGSGQKTHEGGKTPLPRDGAAVQVDLRVQSSRPFPHFSNCGLRWDEGSLG